MWEILQKFASLVANVTFRVKDGKLIEETDCYFIKDPKHDWSAAIVGVEKDVNF